jgi:radical SAM superfamily enzyme YgiQ (UPF0313 family)
MSADYVFISAMSVQQNSAREVIFRCKKMGKKVVAGGPLFTTSHDEFPEVDHFILNEAEVTLRHFIKDLEKGMPDRLYTASEWADIRKTPVPLWNLINMKKYASMNIQFSRGCPFNCDFCNITVLFGRRPRSKTKEQIVSELDGLYAQGWRGNVFFVDDNFIGDKKKLKKELLPALIEWMEKRRHPFTFYTETSIDLADDEDLMRLMVRAGFDSVFVGIETPHEESLIECSKIQNKNRDLIECVKKMQRFGLQVQGGFIVGFDSDPPMIFERLIGFIQESGIVTAMVGLLNAPRGTRLYQRLVNEGRLLTDATGDNTDLSINFIPKMNYESLISGYREIFNTIYSPRHFYERAKLFLKEYKPLQKKMVRFNMGNFRAFFKSVVFLGIVGKERAYYWRLFFWSLFRRPRLFRLAITYMIYGFHFRKIFEHNSRKLSAQKH